VALEYIQKIMLGITPPPTLPARDLAVALVAVRLSLLAHLLCQLIHEAVHDTLSTVSETKQPYPCQCIPYESSLLIQFPRAWV